MIVRPLLSNGPATVRRGEMPVTAEREPVIPKRAHSTHSHSVGIPRRGDR